MAYENLKAAIKQAIKQNGNQEITGSTLQSTLLNLVDNIESAGFIFKGFANPNTVPNVTDQNVFYIAMKYGTYTNFSGINLNRANSNTELGILYGNSSKWVLQNINTSAFNKVFQRMDVAKNPNNHIPFLVDGSDFEKYIIVSLKEYVGTHLNISVFEADGTRHEIVNGYPQNSFIIFPVNWNIVSYGQYDSTGVYPVLSLCIADSKNDINYIYAKSIIDKENTSDLQTGSIILPEFSNENKHAIFKNLQAGRYLLEVENKNNTLLSVTNSSCAQASYIRKGISKVDITTNGDYQHTILFNGYNFSKGEHLFDLIINLDKIISNADLIDDYPMGLNLRNGDIFLSEIIKIAKSDIVNKSKIVISNIYIANTEQQYYFSLFCRVKAGKKISAEIIDKPLYDEEHFSIDITSDYNHIDVTSSQANKNIRLSRKIENSTDVIFDTDFAWDIDDSIALRILSWAHRLKMINIRAVLLNTVVDLIGKSGRISLYALASYMAYERLNNVPIALNKNDYRLTNSGGSYHLKYAFNYFPSSIYNYSNRNMKLDLASDSVNEARSILSSLPANKKIIYISVGHFNNLYDIYNSKADDISNKTGEELFKEHVEKIFIMGGQYPSGKEFNMYIYEPNKTKGFIEACKVPLYFIGGELGRIVSCKSNIFLNNLPDSDYLKQGLKAFNSSETVGRNSWDPLTVLAALDNSIFEWVRGTNIISSDGSNKFEENTAGSHYYAKTKYSDDWYAFKIDKICAKLAWPNLRDKNEVRIL